MLSNIDIHSNLSMVAKNIIVNIDTENLTRNQLKRIANQVANGYATSGNATTSYITRSILREYAIPHFIVGNESNSHMSWKSITPDHPIFYELAGAVAITKLVTPHHEHHQRALADDIRKWERILAERPTTGHVDLYNIDHLVRDKLHAIGRVKIDKDHKVHEVLKALPDMKEFPIVLGREEYSYALPYEEQDKDEDEYYA